MKCNQCNLFFSFNIIPWHLLSYRELQAGLFAYILKSQCRLGVEDRIQTLVSATEKLCTPNHPLLVLYLPYDFSLQSKSITVLPALKHNGGLKQNLIVDINTMISKVNKLKLTICT